MTQFQGTLGGSSGKRRKMQAAEKMIFGSLIIDDNLRLICQYSMGMKYE